MWTLLLSKLPFLSTAASFVTSKARLVIEYLLIGVVITLCGVAVTLWGKNKVAEVNLAKTQVSLETVASRLGTVENANSANQQTISDLQAQRIKDNSSLTDLMGDFKNLTDSDSKVRTRLQNLETSNAIVRNYLGNAVPPELNCLLNNTCSAGTSNSSSDAHSARTPASGVPGAVPATGSTPVRH